MKITLSKTLKLPIQNIQFSNRVVSWTEEHEIDDKKLTEEAVEKLWGTLNRRLKIGLDEDLGVEPKQTEWLRKEKK